MFTAILALASKFCTYEAVTEHKMAVAAGVMGSKIAWELHSRKSRLEDRQADGEVGGEGEWREEGPQTRETEERQRRAESSNATQQRSPSRW